MSFRNSINYLNQLNSQGDGPYLQRSNLVHVKMMNITKAIGVEIRYDNLPNIENLLTNFN
jgi:hypothetical protein